VATGNRRKGEDMAKKKEETGDRRRKREKNLLVFWREYLPERNFATAMMCTIRSVNDFSRE